MTDTELGLGCLCRRLSTQYSGTLLTDSEGEQSVALLRLLHSERALPPSRLCCIHLRRFHQGISVLSSWCLIRQRVQSPGRWAEVWKVDMGSVMEEGQGLRDRNSHWKAGWSSEKCLIGCHRKVGNYKREWLAESVAGTLWEHLFFFAEESTQREGQLPEGEAKGGLTI